jgi:group I intron endonuclease
MGMIGIYKITNPKNKVYIGQSVNIEERFKKYIKLNCPSQTKLLNSLKKYGIDSHKFEIIEECLLENLNDRERYWQDYYNVLEEGLNLIKTKTDTKSGYLSEETKNKIKTSMLGKKIHSDEYKEKLRQRMLTNNPNNIEGVREKIIKNKTGKKQPKISESKKGKKRPDISGEKSFFYKNRPANAGTPKKEIIQIDKLTNEIIQIFPSISEAMRKTNIKGIKDCLSNRQKTSGGFIWKYLN